MQGLSPCLEGVTSGPDALFSVSLGVLALICHAYCVALSRRWPTVPRGCGMERRFSASMPVRLRAPDRFWSWLLVLARDICWPGAKAKSVTRARARPGLPVGRESWRCGRAPEPRAVAAWLARAYPSDIADLLGGGRFTGYRATPFLLGVRASLPDGYSPELFSESVGGSLGLLSFSRGLKIPLC